MATGSAPACPSTEEPCSTHTTETDCNAGTTYEVDSTQQFQGAATDAYTCEWMPSFTPECQMQHQCTAASTTVATAAPTLASTLAPGVEGCNAGGSYTVLAEGSTGALETYMKHARCCTNSDGSNCYGQGLSRLVDVDVGDMSDEDFASICQASSTCKTYACCSYVEEVSNVVCTTEGPNECAVVSCHRTSTEPIPDECVSCQSTVAGVSTTMLEGADDVCETIDVSVCEAHYYRRYGYNELNIKGGGHEDKRCRVVGSECKLDDRVCASAATAAQSSMLLTAASVVASVYALAKG